MAIKTKNEAVTLKAADPNAPVILKVTIGSAQIGSSVAFFQDDPGTIIGMGNISKLNVGVGSVLKGKILTVVTNILNANPSTLKIVATYNFSNCVPGSSVFNDIVDNAGDIFSYHIDFTFQ